jgi:hypothetical protein
MQPITVLFSFNYYNCFGPFFCILVIVPVPQTFLYVVVIPYIVKQLYHFFLN